MFGWRGNFIVFPVVSVYGYCRAIRDVIARLVAKDGKHFVQPQPVYEWQGALALKEGLHGLSAGPVVRLDSRRFCQKPRKKLSNYVCEAIQGGNIRYSHGPDGHVS